MIAQSATAAFLFGAGDIIAQQAIERQGNKHDVRYTFCGSDDLDNQPTCIVHADGSTDLLWRWLRYSDRDC